VVDQGSQFTAKEYKEAVRDHGVRIRYGAVGETHSLGLIDRSFRTLKESLGLPSLRPWYFRDFRRRLGVAFVHYAYVRPHASLEGLTPIEVYYGIRGYLPRPV
jgi:transposase InsO family protein